MDTNNACVFDIDGGTVTKLVLYWDRERMFADLGLVGRAALSENSPKMR
jgi:hypothetical protein